jgi:hypothetical protein
MHLHSFWWRIVNRAFKNSKEPFENVGLACAIFAGLVALGYIFHLITQELGDYMIYWSIAFPVVVLLAWFCWNLIKAPHQIHEEDLATSSSGINQITAKKSVSQRFASFIFVVFLVSAFMVLLAAKNRQISQLKKQLSPPKQIAVTPKPLPPTIIPTNEFVAPTISAPQPTNVVAASQSPSIEPTENFNAPTDDVEDVKAVVAKELAQDEAEKQNAILQEQTQEQAWWDAALPSYNHALKSLDIQLAKMAANKGDGISESPDYFNCLPKITDFKMNALDVAKIRFQKETNMNFLITISPKNLASRRNLNITASGAFLEIRTDPQNCGAHVIIPSLHYDKDKVVGINQANEFFDERLNFFINAQAFYLSQTNK